jgi:hypothetical protein
LQNLGVTFTPTFWGLMACFAEGIGGLLILLVLLFRPATLLIVFTMIWLKFNIFMMAMAGWLLHMKWKQASLSFFFCSPDQGS